MRATAFLAMAVLLAASAVGAAPKVVSAASASQGRPAPRVARVVAPARRALATASAPGVESGASWAGELAPVEVVNRNTDARTAILLYDAHGTVDRDAAHAFMRIAGSARRGPDEAGGSEERLELRLVQLAFRAAYHFGGARISIVSATRAGTRGKHGTGEALDFALEGVKASVLAAYLRGLPRAGVGIYTHPKTQYVHLDVRERSYHWLDGSPPGVTWRERLLRDPKQAARDASWSPASDLPEAR